MPNGGNVTLKTTNGDIIISPGQIDTIGNTPGNIFLSSGGAVSIGSPNSVAGSIDARSYSSGTGGNVTILAGGDINFLSISGVYIPGDTGGGNISLTSINGKISTGILNTEANISGNAGNINLQAKNGIETPSEIPGYSLDLLSTRSPNGNGGNITLSTTNGNIQIGNVNSGGRLQGGNINITASNGNITTSDIRASGNQDGGSITFKSGGAIDTTAGIINAMGGNNGGNISLEAATNISTAGNVTIDAKGTVSTSSINSLTLTPNVSVNGGNIDLNAGTNITTGNINASALNRGGTISFDATGNITAGKIESSYFGTGGDVSMINRSSSSNTIVNQINPQSFGSGTGGNVLIRGQRFLRSTGSFTDRNGINASTSTPGNLGSVDGGSITIYHEGLGSTPFIVGNSAINGTAGAISRGNSNPIQTILRDKSYLYNHKQDADRIQIISVPPPPTPTPAATPAPVIIPIAPIALPPRTPSPSVTPAPTPTPAPTSIATTPIAIAPTLTPTSDPQSALDFPDRNRPPQISCINLDLCRVRSD